LITGLQYTTLCKNLWVITSMQAKQSSILDIVNSGDITTEDALKIIGDLSPEQVLYCSENGLSVLHILAREGKECDSPNIDFQRVVDALVAKNLKILDLRNEMHSTNSQTKQVEIIAGDTPFEWAIRHNNLPLLKALTPYYKTRNPIQIRDVRGGEYKPKTQHELQRQRQKYIRKGYDNKPTSGKVINNVLEEMSLVAFALRHGQFKMLEYLLENGFGFLPKLQDLQAYNLSNPSEEDKQKLYRDLFISGHREALLELHRHLGYYEGRNGVSSQELFDAIKNGNEDKALVLISQGHYAYNLDKHDIPKYDHVNRFGVWIDNIIPFIFLKTLNHPNYDVNARGYNSSSPLQVAAVKKDLSVMRELLNRGANINSINESCNTPLIWAMIAGSPEAAVLLIERGADINLSDNYNQTTLFYAAGHGNLEIVKYLIGKGLDVNEASHFEQTPLQMSCRGGYFEIAQELINNGADVNTVDCHGRTPLSWALDPVYENFNYKLIDLLLANGACPSLGSIFSRTFSIELNLKLAFSFGYHCTSKFCNVFKGVAQVVAGDITEFYDKQASEIIGRSL
jgi:ankyrin repeat protein